LKKLGVTFSDVNGEMKLTADELSKNLAPALRGVSTGALVDFASNFGKVFTDSEGTAGDLALVIDEVLSSALNSAGVDAEIFKSKMTSAGKKAIESFTDIVEISGKTGKSIEDTSNILEATLLETLKAVKTEEGITAISDQLQVLRDNGNITSESFDRMKESLVKSSSDIAIALGGSAAAADELSNALKLDIDSAATVEDLYKIEIAAVKALNAGTISGEQFKNILEDIPAKTTEIELKTEQAAASTDKLADSAEGVAEGFDNASNSASGFASSVAGWINGVTASVWALSDAAGKAFENGLFGRAPQTELERLNAELQKVNDSNDSIRRSFTTDFDVTGLRKAWGEIALSANQVKKEYYEQAIAANTLRDKLNGMSIASLNALDDAGRLERQFGLLDQSTLNSLRSEVQGVRDELVATEKQAQDTLSTLKGELASLQGDDATARKLAAEREILAIQAEISEAKAQGNTKAVRDLQEALAVQQKIHRLEERAAVEAERKAVADEKANQQRDIERAKESAALEERYTSNNTQPVQEVATQYPQQQQTSEVYQLELKTDSGDSVAVKLDSQSDIQNLLRILEQSGATTV
jgi:hypothetical protein